MNKTLKVMTSAALLAGVVAPVVATPANAMSVNGVDKVVYVDSDDYTLATGSGTPTLTIKEDSDFQNHFATGDTFRLALPADVEWNYNDGIYLNYDANGNLLGSNFTLNVVSGTNSINASAVTTVFVRKTSDQTLEVKFEKVNGSSKDIITFPMNTTIDTEGDIKVTIDPRESALTAQSITFAVASSGDTVATIADTKTIGENGAVIETVRIDESAIGAMSHKNAMGNHDYQYVEVKLPPNFKFDVSGTSPDPTPKISFAGGFDSNVTDVKELDGTALTPSSNAVTVTNDMLTDGNRTIGFYFKQTADADKRGTIYLTGLKVVPTSDASFTDAVELEVSGDEVTDATLNIGKYADYGVTIEVDGDTPTLVSGRLQDTDDLESAWVQVKEAIDNSLIDRKTVVTFPEWVKVVDVKTKDVNNVAISDDADGSSNKVELRVTPQSGKGEFKLQFILSVRADATGDIVAKAEGNAGIEGEIVVAKAASPVAAEATKAEVKVGIQNQVIGDIVITEPAKEAIKKGELKVTLPDNVEWNGKPKVEVVDGNIDLGSVSIDDEVLTIKVDSQSTKASKIKISGASIDLDRSIAEGVIDAKIGGSALVENDKASTYSVNADSSATNASELDDQEFDRDYAVKLAVATVVTPAPDNVSAQEVKLVIGQNTMTVGDKEVALDAAPFIEASTGRTYLPLRAIAEAVGANSVDWNNAARTATVIKEGLVAQMTIGQNQYLLNGAKVGMDGKAQIVNERTVLPIRALGQALGANVQWDAATQTVTIK